MEPSITLEYPPRKADVESVRVRVGAPLGGKLVPRRAVDVNYEHLS